MRTTTALEEKEQHQLSYVYGLDFGLWTCQIGSSFKKLQVFFLSGMRTKTHKKKQTTQNM